VIRKEVGVLAKGRMWARHPRSLKQTGRGLGFGDGGCWVKAEILRWRGRCIEFASTFRHPFLLGVGRRVVWPGVDTLVRLANGGRKVGSFARFFRIAMAWRTGMSTLLIFDAWRPLTV